jgi:hypothetical protein
MVASNIGLKPCVFYPPTCRACSAFHHPSEEHSVYPNRICLIQRDPDRPDNAIHFLFYAMIPKADHFISLRFQVFGSFSIVFRLFKVLTAIEFNDEFLLDGDKINDVIADSVLTPETHPIRLIPTQN